MEAHESLGAAPVVVFLPPQMFDSLSSSGQYVVAIVYYVTQSISSGTELSCFQPLAVSAILPLSCYMHSCK